MEMTMDKKTPHLKQGGTKNADRETRALAAAQAALDGLSDDPRVMQMFIAMVPLLGVVRLRNISQAKKQS
jgi:hypothetical protein